MLELGKYQKLKIVKKTDFGVYLSETADTDEKVLLPKKQVPSGAGIGDEVEIFLIRDSKDRLIATVRKPLITLGETAYLDCVEVTGIGAFLNMGLERDLLLPYHEMAYKVKAGDKCLVAMYVDKSGRLAATGRVYKYLKTGAPYKTGDDVNGTIYEINDKIGAFAAVDGVYSALIPAKEWAGEYKCGDNVKARVTRVREDGKLNISIRQKAYLQIGPDADFILNMLKENGGSIPFNDRAEAEFIKEKCHMSKNAFKRAVGHLLKQGMIKIGENSIESEIRSDEGGEL